MSILLLTDFGLLTTGFPILTEMAKLSQTNVGKLHIQQLRFLTVLTDTRYAAKDLILYIENLKKLYYCPIRDNRLVDDSGNIRPYRHTDSLERNDEELGHGRIVEIKDFPKHHKVRLFRVVLSSRRTDYVVTNDMAQNDTSAVRNVCGIR